MRAGSDARPFVEAIHASQVSAALMSASSQAAAPGVDTEAQRARALLEKGEFAQALAAATALLQAQPRHRDALYMMAVSQRYLKRVPEALATLDELERWHPKFSRLHQERGHCFVARRDAPKA